VESFDIEKADMTTLDGLDEYLVTGEPFLPALYDLHVQFPSLRKASGSPTTDTTPMWIPDVKLCCGMAAGQNSDSH
jgi:hypothetical protein